MYQADVSVAAEIDAAVERAVEELGGLDVVVVNAGVYDDALALEVTPEVAQSIAGVNYLGALYTAQAGARCMPVWLRTMGGG